MENSVLQPGRMLGVIGAGVMGTTLIRGLLDAGLVTRAQVWATARTQKTCTAVAEDLGIAAARDYRHVAEASGIILVCCKPAQIAAVCEKLREAGVRHDTLLISILAGVTTERLESLLPGIWIRAVPNTPCVTREGMTVVCAGRESTAEHLEIAQRIFTSVGRCIAVEEHYCNAVTALTARGRSGASRAMPRRTTRRESEQVARWVAAARGHLLRCSPCEMASI